MVQVLVFAGVQSDNTFEDTCHCSWFSDNEGTILLYTGISPLFLVNQTTHDHAVNQSQSAQSAVKDKVFVSWFDLTVEMLNVVGKGSTILDVGVDVDDHPPPPQQAVKPQARETENAPNIMVFLKLFKICLASIQ